MANPDPAQSQTEQAMRYEREAYTERICKNPPTLLPMWKRKAAELRVLPKSPDIGIGGEVVREQTKLPGERRPWVRDTLSQAPDIVAEEASVRRTDLLMQPSFNAVALGVDAAESIDAANSLEKMLAHQLAVTHEMMMRFADRALSYEHGRAGDQVEASRCANTTARLANAFQDGLLVLQKLRTGGNQTVTVQHVNIQSGAQAVIGSVQTGGPRRRGSNAK